MVPCAPARKFWFGASWLLVENVVVKLGVQPVFALTIFRSWICGSMRATRIPRLFSSARRTASSAGNRLVCGAAAASWLLCDTCAKTDADVPKTATNAVTTLTRVTIVRISANSTLCFGLCYDERPQPDVLAVQKVYSPRMPSASVDSVLNRFRKVGALLEGHF